MENKNNDKKKVHKKKKYLIIGLVIVAVVLSGVCLYSLGSDDADADMQAAARQSRRHHKQNKNAREFEVQLIDSIDASKVRSLDAGNSHKHWAGNTVSHAGKNLESPAVSNRLNAAYCLGMSFASDGEEAEALRNRLVGMVVPTVEQNNVDSLKKFFFDCVSCARSDGENGIAAIIMAGYYFGSLNNVLQYVDDATQLPDEKSLAAGIKRMNNLKDYLNDALTAEKEVKTTMAIQRLEAAADSVEHAYYNCQTDYDENGPKYEKLTAAIKNIEDVFK